MCAHFCLSHHHITVYILYNKSKRFIVSTSFWSRAKIFGWSLSLSRLFARSLLDFRLACRPVPTSIQFIPLAGRCSKVKGHIYFMHCFGPAKKQKVSTLCVCEGEREQAKSLFVFVFWAINSISQVKNIV